MESYPAAPGRPLSAAQQVAIEAFYKPRLAELVVVGTLLPLIAGALAGLAYGLATDTNDWEGFLPVGLGAAVVAIVLAQLLLRRHGRRKMARAEFIYQYGQPESVTFVGLTSGRYRHNQRPQTIINLLRGTEPLQIKTFDDRIITAFMRPQQLVYEHPRYPNVLVPGSLLAPGYPAGPATGPRVVEV